MQANSNSKREHRQISWSAMFRKPDPLGLEQPELRLMLTADLSYHGLWSVRGDSTPGNLSDNIRIQVDPDRPDNLQAIVNDQIIDTQPLEDIQAIRINSGKGDDAVAIDLPAELSRISVTLYGGKGDDTLIGSVNHDAIYGGPGNDTIKGRAGDDFLFGGNGADHIDGQEGDDQLFGGKKRDRLYSGDGVDNLFGGSGRNIFYSQHGVNQLNSGSAKDLIMSYSDSDTLMISRNDIAIEQVESSSIDPWAASQDPRQVLIDLAVKRWQW